MGLADKIADIIRPRPRGLFVRQRVSVSARDALSSAMIADDATASVAREATQNFIRALSRDVNARLAAALVSPEQVTRHGDDEIADVVTRHVGSALVPRSVTCVVEGGDAPARVCDQATAEQIGKLAREAGDVAGLWAAGAGASRQAALAKARDTEETVRTQLQARVDAGEPLPINRNLLERVGFDDVATRGTPPPISITCMPDVMSRVNFTTDRVDPDEMAMREMREMREMIKNVFHEQLPQELAAGIREATSQVVW